MKRIDLISKLFAPIFISLAAMMVKHPVILALAVAGMNMALLLPEWLCAKWVWSACAKLRAPRQGPASPIVVDEGEDDDYDSPPSRMRERWGSGLKIYFDNNAWRRMIFPFPALELVINLSSLPLARTAVLFCALTISIDDDLPPKCALYLVPDNRSPIIQFHHRVFLYHHHALSGLLSLQIHE